MMIPEEAFKAASILIVDDQQANVLLLKKVLDSQQFQRVTGLTDPCLVEEICAREAVDLVLLDISMPRRNGFEVLESLRNCPETEDVPVIILTAQTDEESRLKAFSAGARDYLTKPFSRPEVLQRLRNQLAVRLSQQRLRAQNAELAHMVETRNAELDRARREVIDRLGRAGGARDNETGTHVERMSRYVVQVAEALKVDTETCELLRAAATMHDIGKIGIPDAILLKQGRLTPAEFEQMKRHTLIGAEILDSPDSPLLAMARRIALSHHEKWDGCGYPNGLKGDEIPLEGRITAVCDVFDALTTARPYKDAWQLAEAICYLREQRGRHFDPAVIDAFFSVFDVLMEIRERFADE